ncbi:putative GTP-binding protein, partial [Toxoplasma gondii TgCatPRC2]
ARRCARMHDWISVCWKVDVAEFLDGDVFSAERHDGGSVWDVCGHRLCKAALGCR